MRGINIEQQKRRKEIIKSMGYICKVFNDKRFPCVVRAYIPISMENEITLSINMSNLQFNVTEYRNKIIQIQNVEQKLRKIRFDVDKTEKLKLLDSYKRELRDIENRLNKDISPYAWKIEKVTPIFFNTIENWCVYLEENGKFIIDNGDKNE